MIRLGHRLGNDPDTKGDIDKQLVSKQYFFLAIGYHGLQSTSNVSDETLRLFDQTSRDLGRRTHFLPDLESLSRARLPLRIPRRDTLEDDGIPEHGKGCSPGNVWRCVVARHFRVQVNVLVTGGEAFKKRGRSELFAAVTAWLSGAAGNCIRFKKTGEIREGVADGGHLPAVGGKSASCVNFAMLTCIFCLYFLFAYWRNFDCWRNGEYGWAI